ncbi:MAG: hypothetical protein ACK4ZU_06325 [Allorhizobium sp.]
MQIMPVRDATVVFDVAGMRLLIEPWIAGKLRGELSGPDRHHSSTDAGWGTAPVVMNGEMVPETVGTADDAAVDAATVSPRRFSAVGAVSTDRLVIPEDGEILTF